MHTRLFGSLAAVCAVAPVGLLAALAVAPDSYVSFTIQQAAAYSALVCLGLTLVTAMSACCDILGGE